MRILLLGDFSNYHACLGGALRRLGHEVTVASEGSGWMHTSRTLSLRRPLPGPAGGALLYMRMLADRRLRGYDVVSIISPAFVTLRPHRLRHVFDRLKRHNGRVYLTAAGTDKAMMDMLTAPDCPLDYSEYYSAPGVPYPPNADALMADMLWQQGAVARWCEEVYDRVDGIGTALYEYDLAVRRAVGVDKPVRYLGIPIDLDAVKASPLPFERTGRVNIFLGRDASRMAVKGTDRLERAARRVVADLPGRCELTIVENRPYKDYLGLLSAADVVLDQLYSYTPATNALLAMAMGKAVVSGGEQAFYDFIDETALRPVINAVPDDDGLYRTLRRAVENPQIIIDASRAGRPFVKRHNAATLVAERALSLWTL